MITVYRLSSSRFAPNSGVGAALYGGRWNEVGLEAIYAARTRSLAVLEVLVHFSALPLDYVVTKISIPASAGVLTLDRSELPKGWADGPVSAVTQEIGSRWIREGKFAVLSVPSAIIQEERNFVINPRHPQFKEIVFGPPQPFAFDPRLAGR